MSDIVKPNTRPLRYIVEALGQMEGMVRDFGMSDTARLLEKARLEIESNLAVTERLPGPERRD